MNIRVHDSALKHDVAPEDSTHVATWPIWIDDLDEDNPAAIAA